MREHPEEDRCSWVPWRCRGGVERSGLPIALHIDSASPHEVTLVVDTLAPTFVGDLPERLIGDQAYDSARPDEVLRKWGRGDGLVQLRRLG